jgi:N-acetylglucosamine-6-sulfatase
MRFLFLVLGLLLLAPTASAGPPEKPSVVIVMADDLAWREMTYLPGLRASLKGAVIFNDHQVTTALCCPSRTSTFTGQYAHNHGVFGEGGAKGVTLKNTVQARFRADGFTTVLLGKYLNANNGESDPGWTISRGAPSHRGPKADADKIADRAVEIIETHPEPLYLYLTPGQPHKGTHVAKRYKEVEVDAACSGKCAKRVRRMLAVEDLVERVVLAMGKRPYILIFTSDNGLLLGEHGQQGKGEPWDAASRVPLYIKGPWAPRTVEALTANIDLPPTLLDLYGLAPDKAHDGRSLKPFLQGAESSWRTRLLLENVIDHKLDEALVTEDVLYRRGKTYTRIAEQEVVRPPAPYAAWIEALRQCAGQACRTAD